MFEKELKNYKQNFDNDLESIRKTTIFAKDAIEFIMKKKLYPEFLQFQVDKRNNEYNPNMPRG